MTEDDRCFYSRRLREELEQAATASEPVLRDLHAQWAKLYKGRLAGLEQVAEMRELEAAEAYG